MLQSDLAVLDPGTQQLLLHHLDHIGGTEISVAGQFQSDGSRRLLGTHPGR